MFPEILLLTDDEVDELVCVGEPLVFTLGSSEAFGEMRLQPDRLVVELERVDGSGRGLIPLLVALTDRYAERQDRRRVEWLVHADGCKSPELEQQFQDWKFESEHRLGIGTVHRLLHRVSSDPDPLPDETQRQHLASMMSDAFIEIRLLTNQGHTEQAAALADTFHNLGREIYGQGGWSRSHFRDALEAYQQKYRSKNRAVGGRNYVALLDAIFPSE